MYSRKIPAIIAFIFCIGCLSGYTYFRASNYETSYLSYLSKRYSKINESYNAFSASYELTPENVIVYLKKLTEENDDLSMVGIKDSELRLIRLSANSGVLSHGELYDDLSDVICSGQLVPAQKQAYIIHYFKGTKYYVITQSASSGSVITVYPRSLPAIMIARISAEAFAVISSSLLLFWGLFALFGRLRRKTAPKDVKIKSEKNTPAENMSPDEKLYTVLKDIVLEVDAISVTLIILIAGKKHARQIGWNQGRFFSAKIPNVHSVETNDAVLKEIGKGAYVIRDRGKRIIVPVIADKTLLAVFAVSLPKKATGANISLIKKRTNQIATLIKE